jgi:PAS domain S-box-containing protein
MKLTESTARTITLMLALAVIVGTAFAIRANVTRSTMNAMDWVSHSRQVKAVLYELRAVVNEMEAAAFAAQMEPLSERAAKRYGEARGQYAQLLDQLRELTHDNPDQQARIGALGVQIEGRVDLFDEAMLNRAQGRDSAAGQGLRSAVTRYPIKDIMDSIADAEDDLIDQRSQAVARQALIGSWVIGVVTVLQFLLLAGVIWGSEKQLQRRLAAEREARLAVARADRIVEAVREPIAVLTGELAIVSCNRAFADYYGLERPTSGAPLGENEAWTDAALQQRLRDVSLTRREMWDYEISQSTQAGQVRHVLVNARPMELPDASETLTLLTVSDITARKQSERQIIELNRQLEGKVAQISESNRELEAFSYTVSHDLRAPLRHIAGFSEKLLARMGEGAGADEKARHYGEVVVEASQRMSALIEDLLTYSRLGRHAMRYRPVDMQALVEETQIALSAVSPEREIVWRIASLPVVIADENMMRLVWQNLIDNAMKYSASRNPASIEIGTDDSNASEWIFSVRDNGVGFDMAYADKLFGVFQRLHKASQFPGTGIGLASVRRIIARHGGRIWAESAPDQGATFRFSIARTQ